MTDARDEEVSRQLGLLYEEWAREHPGDDDPDDAPEFVAKAREIAGLPPLTDIEVQAAAGKDVTPGSDELHHYWVAGPGLARWTTWTELLAGLVEEVHDKPLETLKEWAAAWFHERYGFWPGADLNRVRQGKPPRGDRIGPG